MKFTADGRVVIYKEGDLLPMKKYYLFVYIFHKVYKAFKEKYESFEII